MFRIIALATATAVAADDHYRPHGLVAVYNSGKCRHSPKLVVKARPGECTHLPGSRKFFQLLCGYEKSYADGRDKEGSYSTVEWGHDSKDYIVKGYGLSDSSSDSSSGSWTDASDSWSATDSSSSSSSSKKDDSSSSKKVAKSDSSSSSSSSSKKDDSSSSSSNSKRTGGLRKKVHRRSRPSTVAVRICNDKHCNKCKRVIVTKSKKCAHLPARNYWSAEHWNGRQWCRDNRNRISNWNKHQGWNQHQNGAGRALNSNGQSNSTQTWNSHHNNWSENQWGNHAQKWGHDNRWDDNQWDHTQNWRWNVPNKWDNNRNWNAWYGYGNNKNHRRSFKAKCPSYNRKH